MQGETGAKPWFPLAGAGRAAFGLGAGDMAKKTRGRSASPIVTANPIPGLLRPPVPRPPITPPIVMSDERLYSPLRLRQPLAAGRPARLKVPSTGSFRRGRIQFQSASVVDTCIRRKTRREILFARKRTRKGAFSKKRVRNAFSNISCK